MYLYFSNDTFSSRSQNLVLLIHKCNALGYSTFRCVLRFEGVTDCNHVFCDIMLLPTLTVYTDSEPAELLGADDEEGEEQLPPVDSPTAESPGHVTESYPEEDLEEYEDDEIEDGPVDYPMDGGDDGDDDNGDSSRDDADGKNEDEEDEDEVVEHLAPGRLTTTVIPVNELVFPPEGTKPVIPPPFTNITIGDRITVWPQTFISLPLEAEVERLLTMTTPSPSPPISLSPPSAGERWPHLHIHHLYYHHLGVQPKFRHSVGHLSGLSCDAVTYRISITTTTPPIFIHTTTLLYVGMDIPESEL
ncbi:hypothetical protein Tco_0675553 [Tanacetum coccineum]